MNFTNEQISKARQAKSSEELLTLAKENGVELSAEQAKTYFTELHKESELSENELDTVAGGNKEPEKNDYFYPNMVNAPTNYFWKPICPNELGLYCCGKCFGFREDDHDHGNGYCNGKHHKRSSAR